MLQTSMLKLLKVKVKTVTNMTVKLIFFSPCPDPPSPTLSLEEPMAVLQVEGGDDDADSAFGTISDSVDTKVRSK